MRRGRSVGKHYYIFMKHNWQLPASTQNVPIGLASGAMMRAALLPHLVLGFVLLWSPVCDTDASVVDGDGSGRIWKPTPEHPLPVSSVAEFMNSGNLGLNNVLWMNVAATAFGGCSTNHEHGMNRVDDSNRTAPIAFGVVILPPIRTDLGKTQDVEMHQYSEIFDLEHQQQFYMKHRNCYITDKINFERQQKDGSLQVLKDAVTKRILRRPPFTDEDKHHFYQGLELSQRLLEKYYEPCVAKMRRIFQHGESFYTTLHMRVEDDWASYCKQKEFYSKRANEPVKWCFGADEIANITLASKEIHGHHNFLLLYAGDKFDSTNRHRRTESMRTDPTKVWPKDVRIANPTHMGCFDQDQPSYTERSAVSMFLAADADVYVGTMKSSFFQGVSTIRGLSRPFSGDSYAYDGDSPEYKHLKQYHPQIPFSPWPEDEDDEAGRTYG